MSPSTPKKPTAMNCRLELFEKVYRSGVCKGWPRFGLVVQAYSKTSKPTLCWISALAKECGDEIPVRLVKGAYWDNEIKWSQENGLTGYPVFTRKSHSDISYLACARYLLSDDTDGAIYPQFATHNAQTIVSIQHMNEAAQRRIEFQRLHGMGDNLYDTLMEQDSKLVVRIYAPVGPHRDRLVPTWFAACWKMAQTRRLCTNYWMQTRR